MSPLRDNPSTFILFILFMVLSHGFMSFEQNIIKIFERKIINQTKIQKTNVSRHGLSLKIDICSVYSLILSPFSSVNGFSIVGISCWAKKFVTMCRGNFLNYSK